MELCRRWEETAWHIDKHAQIGMGFIRKNRQLIFGLERNRREIKKVHNILSLHI
jgi:hypothetical protein